VTQIFIVSGTSWTVPTDWNSANNTVETIGAGGGGQTANGSYAGSGGGGGAYSKITNLSLTAGSSITIQVGTGGSAGIAGGDTWFNGASLAASSVGAKGGGGGGDGSGGAGGAASSGVGTTKYNGGNGGTDTANPYGAGGGGGAEWCWISRCRIGPHNHVRRLWRRRQWRGVLYGRICGL
jgi:hypothetical protein